MQLPRAETEHQSGRTLEACLHPWLKVSVISSFTCKLPVGMHQNSVRVSPIKELIQYLRKLQHGGVLARLPRNCLLGCCSSSQSPFLETGGNFWDSTTVCKAWPKATLEYYGACWNVPSAGELAKPAMEWAFRVLAPHTAGSVRNKYARDAKRSSFILPYHLSISYWWRLTSCHPVNKESLLVPAAVVQSRVESRLRMVLFPHAPLSRQVMV